MNNYNQVLAVLGGLIALCILTTLSPSDAALMGGICIFFGCPILGLIGFICLFGKEQTWKFGLKLIALSLVGFLVGMSICSQTIRL